MSITQGWAVESFGQLLVKTVSDTRRAAIVNWLVTAQRQMVYSYDTDEAIEKMWRERRDDRDTRVVQVSVASV